MIVTDLLPDFPSVVFGLDDSAVLLDCCFLFSFFVFFSYIIPLFVFSCFHLMSFCLSALLHFRSS